MKLNNNDFLMSVNLAIFKLDITNSSNSKKLPKRELMVLLQKREKEPFKDCWLFPYKLVDINQSLDDAVYSIIKEKINLPNIYFEQLYTWGAVDRDPSARVIATSYLAIVPHDSIREDLIEKNKNLRWFTVSKDNISNTKISDTQSTYKYIMNLYNKEDNLNISYTVIEDSSVESFEIRKKYSYESYLGSSEKMAYDHIKILDYALDRIKNKVLYTNIAFGLISPNFTLTELQQVYEILLGKKLIKPNFRQKIKNKVEPTSTTIKEGAYRPSKVYTVKRSALLNEN